MTVRWRWLALAAAAVAVVVVARSAIAVQLVAATVVLLVCTAVVLFGRRRTRITDWRDAEIAVARWLRHAGCKAVSMTGGSADGGLDVITLHWAVQVKHTARRVGRPALQQLVGAALTVDREPALFSTSGFTAPAIDYAAEHRVALFELALDGKAVAINAPARQVGKRRLGSKRR